MNSFSHRACTKFGKTPGAGLRIYLQSVTHFPEIQSDTEPVVDRIQSKISRWLPVYPVLRILLPLAEKTRLLHAPGAPRRGKTIHRLLRWTVYRRHRHRGINAYPVICRRLGRFQLYLCRSLEVTNVTGMDQFAQSCASILRVCTSRYGGPDNLKSGVSKACKYEPDLNPTYRDMAEHYGCAVLPARPYRPRYKAKVEAGVLIAQRWILQN